MFIRTDIQANLSGIFENVHDTRLSTTISNGSASVSTVEHLLSALAGLGIDNATIELDGPEVPIMDGSSRPFVFLIQSAGIKEQNHPKKFIKITKDIEVKQNDKWAKIEPFDGFKVAFTIDLTIPLSKGNQTSTIDFSTISYLKPSKPSKNFWFCKRYRKFEKK